MVLIGGIRKTTGNRIEANFPFKFKRSLDFSSSTQFFNQDAGVKFIAHRGSTFFDVPENTIDSVVEAKKLGFKYTEFDFLETSDSEFVVMHDLTINRTCINNDGSDISGDVAVASSTLANLRGNYKLRGIAKYQKKIPTLGEYLQAISQNNLHPVIEIKYNMTAGKTAKLVSEVRKFFKDEEVIFISFYSAPLLNVKALMNSQFFLVGSSDISATAKANGLHTDLERSIVTQAVADYCATNSMELITWTNSGDGVAYLNDMINKGVRWLSTDTMPAYDFDKGIPVIKKVSKTTFADFTLTSATATEGVATISAGGKIVNNGNTLLGRDVIFIDIEFKGKITIQFANQNGTLLSKEIENIDFKRVRVPFLNKIVGSYAMTLLNSGTTDALVTDLEFKIYNL